MTIASDIAAFQDALNQFNKGGITNFGGAIQALQSAGNAAVSAIGPAIDSSSGNSSQVMTITQWAWTKNGELAGVNSGDNATQDDLNTAMAAVSQMIAWYNQANRLAASLGVKPVTVAAPKPVATAAPVAAAVPVTAAKPVTTALVAPAAAKPLVTSTEAIAAGAGGFLGFAIGARAVSLAVGGPIGLVLGSTVGFLITKALNK